MRGSKCSMGLVVLAGLFGVAGCPENATSSNPDASASATAAPLASVPTSPSGLPSTGDAPLTEPARRAFAEAVVDSLAAGNYETVRARFDERMNAALPDAAAVEKLWVGIVGPLGKYQKRLSSKPQSADDHYVWVVTCAFEKSTMNVSVVTNESGTIAGLQLVPAQSARVRPQTPKPPFDYDAEDVVFDNPADQSTIAGTLTMPKGRGPHPAVLIISGSGPQDRDGTMFGHQPYWVIADHLTRHGFAVLRTDDRGTGKSTGNPDATVQGHASDVESGLAFLKTRSRVDGKRIGLIGHSEGGVIAPMVAAKSTDVAFIVSLAGPGVSGAELNPMQVRTLLTAEGRDPPMVAQVVEGQKKLMALIVNDAPKPEVIAALEALAKTAALGTGADPEDPAVREQLGRQFSLLLTPWFRSWAKVDPAQYLARVKVPVLVMIGDKDMQVPADVNLGRVKAALTKARNTKVTALKLPGLNHLFQTAKTGAMQEYEAIDETISPTALDPMTTWLRTVAGLDAP